MGSYLRHGHSKSSPNNNNHRRLSILHGHTRRESAPPKTSSLSLTVSDSIGQPTTIEGTDVSWPFGQIEGLKRDEIREAAYEIFFSCRSSPGISSGRQGAPVNLHGGDGGGSSSPMRGNGVGMVATSKIKRALGLKQQLMRMPSRRSSTGMVGSLEFSGSNNYIGSPRRGGGSYGAVPAKTMARRPLTSAEVMRIQMKMTEQTDNRLRKALTRALAGQSRNNNKQQQMAKRPETIILPLELLRHLKSTEFPSMNDYHTWQRRQLHLLTAGLITYPSSTTTDDHSSNRKLLRTAITNLQQITSCSQNKPIDTSIHSDTMQSLCNSVTTLTSWHDNVCHWVDGYPLNINIYVTLLQAVFEDTMMLDQVDELIELMKKTWSLLGITRETHNVCFSWVLFNQYVVTGEVECELLGAAVKVLDELQGVRMDHNVKVLDELQGVRMDRNVKVLDELQGVRMDRRHYEKALGSVLMSMIDWGEKRLMNYHHYEGFGKLENLVGLVFKARNIRLADDDDDDDDDRVDLYIRSSLKTAFAKVLDRCSSTIITSSTLIKLAQATEELAMKEKESYTHILRRWNPMAGVIAALTLHDCYGEVLRHYLTAHHHTILLSTETLNILQTAHKLENILYHMAVDYEDHDDYDFDDDIKINRESLDMKMKEMMVPYQVDSIVLELFKKWIDDGLVKLNECVKRAKEIETWNPKSKTEPFAQSAMELINLTKEFIHHFIELQMATDHSQDLSNALETVILDYVNFVSSSCGTKQNYLPSLPPLTRCNQDSRLCKLLRKASCGVGSDQLTIPPPTYYYVNDVVVVDHNYYAPQPYSTSRGTQRLYIRLNTLHYLLTHLNSLSFNNNNNSLLSHFNDAVASIKSAIHHVAQVAAYRLIFLDSHPIFCESLYASGVTNSSSRIHPLVDVINKNLTHSTEVLIDPAQPLAAKEVMKASFQAFLTVLLAGGSNRVFYRHDNEVIREDFKTIKRVFYGFIAEDQVDKEAEVVEQVIGLMDRSTEELIEQLCAKCDVGGVRKLPMLPPTTGKWNREDPNTILRVLCHRDDQVANTFLKKTFQLPKRR